MPSVPVTIRPLQPQDETAWRTLWAAYCAFYNETVSEDVTAALWSRLHEPNGVIRGLTALDTDGNLFAFAHYVLHPHTWSSQTLCYLEDLFVAETARGQGIASALIKHLVARGKEQNWRRVYWHTHTDNEIARRVYDRFTPADAYVRYTLSL